MMNRRNLLFSIMAAPLARLIPAPEPITDFAVTLRAVTWEGVDYEDGNWVHWHEFGDSGVCRCGKTTEQVYQQLKLALSAPWCKR